jgi:hypothetical protein
MLNLDGNGICFWANLEKERPWGTAEEEERALIVRGDGRFVGKGTGQKKFSNFNLFHDP